MLVTLIAAGLPRTILADLGVVEPEGSWVYYVLALAPFALWCALAIFRRTPTPIKDHITAGALYGLSLIAVHEILWSASTSQGHHLPQVGSGLVLHAYTSGIALAIGLGVGILAAAVATTANKIRR